MIVGNIIIGYALFHVLLKALHIFFYSIISQAQWLTVVILAIQEAEIEKIMVQSQPRLTCVSQHKKGLALWLKW
jgi:hypothetical protein